MILIEVKKFLKKYKAYRYSGKDAFIGNFTKEMKQGLETRSSLPMLESYVTNSFKIENHQPHLLIDAGGTNLRMAEGYVSFYNNLMIGPVSKYKMPGLTKEYSKDAFYKKIAKYSLDVTKDYSNVGYCFSFAFKSNKDLDGKVIRIGKGLKIDDVVGSYVGKETSKALDKNMSHKTYVINDTVATVLGKEKATKKEGNYLGYILGTGFNICYYEKISNIKKIHSSSKGKMIVSIEAAYFDKFEKSYFEEEILNTLEGKTRIEKCISGLYFSKLINLALNTAAKDKLISLNKKANYNSEDYSNFIKGESNEVFRSFNNFKDVKFAKSMIKQMTKRNAYLNALMLAAVIKKSYIKGKTNYIVAEGSTFHKFPKLKKYIIKYTKLLAKHYGRVKFVYGKNLNLKGALFVASAK